MKSWQVRVAVEWDAVTYGETKADAIDILFESLRSDLERNKLRVPRTAKVLVYKSTATPKPIPSRLNPG